MRIPIHVDGVTHLLVDGRIACGLRVLDRTWTTLLGWHKAAENRAVDCMTCLVVETKKGEA